MSSTVRKNLETSEIPTDWAQPIVKETLSDRAYTALRAALMRGQLKSGEQLRLRPTSARFGISATPMREALLRLVVERALTVDARNTVTVPTLTLDQLLEIRSLRVDLEGRTAAAAARCATLSDIDGLEAIHEQIIDCHQSGNFARAVDLNTEFHLTLCKMARQPITYELVEGLWVRCGPILSHLYDAGVPKNWQPHPHLRIITALRNADADAAHAAMRKDIEKGGKGLLNHVSGG